MSKIILFACAVVAVASQALSYDIQPIFEHNNLARTILKSGRSLGDYPERSVNCFLIYLPQLNAATDDYEQKYNSCMEKTATANERIENEVAADRKNVEGSGNGICDEYSKCAAINSSANYFECYNKAAGETITASYNIQTVSKERSQYIAFRSQMIKYDQDTCTEKCKSEYVEESAKLYAALDNCLAGAEHVPGTTAPAPVTTAEPATVA